MKLLKLLSNNGFISCNKAIARLLGLTEAILLGELCSISEMFGGEEFYFSQEKISNDTTLSEYQICNALKHLKEEGVLNITKKGLPCRNFYSINENKVMELLDSETSSQKIKEQTPEKFMDSCQKNSGTFNNKNTEIRIQNKNTPLYEECEKNKKTKELNIGDLQKELYSLLETHNNTSTQDRKIPVSTSFWAFIQKESRELLDSYKDESPEIILQSFKNYLYVAELSGTWKKIFSWKDFLKNFIDYTPNFFSEKKFSRNAVNNQEIISNSTTSKDEKEIAEKKQRHESALIQKFESMIGVRIYYAEKIFNLYLENNLPCNDYREFQVQFASVSEKIEDIHSKDLYEKFLQYVEEIKKGVAIPMSFAEAINTGVIKLE